MVASRESRLRTLAARSRATTAAETHASPLLLINAADGQELVLHPRRLVLAGYTGRDRQSVQQHIDELAAEGIPPPEQVPALYPGSASDIQVGGRLPPGAGWSSGEVEYVLFVTDLGLLVGVGSDHTDRDLERASVIGAKQAFSKIVGARVWPLGDLANKWDSLIIRSWVTHQGGRRPYQEAALATILPPAELLDLLAPTQRGPGLVLFAGTVPAIEPAPRSGQCRFEGEIARPNGEVLLSCRYEYNASSKFRVQSSKHLEP